MLAAMLKPVRIAFIAAIVFGFVELWLRFRITIQS
jgi:hypothetical protein